MNSSRAVSAEHKKQDSKPLGDVELQETADRIRARAAALAKQVRDAAPKPLTPRSIGVYCANADLEHLEPWLVKKGWDRTDIAKLSIEAELAANFNEGAADFNWDLIQQAIERRDPEVFGYALETFKESQDTIERIIGLVKEKLSTNAADPIYLGMQLKVIHLLNPI